jgi:hypothetical protein
MRWPPAYEALKLSRKRPGLHECASCKGMFKANEVAKDHIEPVIDLQKGFTNWDDYVNRLFVPVEGYQILCKPCHESKTLMEDQMREYFKKKNKVVDKD